jgi:Mn2+/Fe2+ NRAMP family transporter
MATGQGLTGLVRERFGVRWVTFLTIAMLIANVGSIVAEFAGTAAALSLFHVPAAVSAVLAASVVILLLTRGSFGKVQYLFVAVGIGVSLAYFASALMSNPDWGKAVGSLLIPSGNGSAAYWLAVVATVGTTITPWGQAFIQSYCADKRLGPEDLIGERLDVGLGALLTNLIAAFIVVACASALWSHNVQINTNDPSAVASIAQALAPLAGEGARILFAVGLLAASFLGLGVVPLTSAYAACEAFGWETGVNWRWREAPAFYGLLVFFIIFAGLIVLIPGIPLVEVMLMAQVLNALLLPFVLVFVMLLASDKKLMGPLVSGRFLQVVGWTGTVLLVVLSLTLAWSTFFAPA